MALPRREVPTTGSISLTRYCTKCSLLKANLHSADTPDWHVLLHWHDPRTSWRNYQEPLCIPHKGKYELWITAPRVLRLRKRYKLLNLNIALIGRPHLYGWGHIWERGTFGKSHAWCYQVSIYLGSNNFIKLFLNLSPGKLNSLHLLKVDLHPPLHSWIYFVS